MDTIDLIKFAVDLGTVGIFAVIVYTFTKLLGVAITTMEATNRQQASLCAKAQALLENELEEEKTARMKLEERFEDECKKTAQLRTDADQLRKTSNDQKRMIDQLNKQLAEKNARIDELEKKILELEVSDVAKDVLIEELQKELESVVKERDELKSRLDALEKKTGNDEKT